MLLEATRFSLSVWAACGSIGVMLVTFFFSSFLSYSLKICVRHSKIS